MDCKVGGCFGMTKMVLAEQTKTPMPAFFQKEYLITTQRYSFAVRKTVDGYKEPIDLPFASPFYLMAFRPHCQEVLYTIHKTEYIAYDTEDGEIVPISIWSRLLPAENTLLLL